MDGRPEQAGHDAGRRGAQAREDQALEQALRKEASPSDAESEPDRRIDYVFVRHPRRDALGEVLDCRVVCNDERGGVWPSDHFGVFAELRDTPLDRSA